MTLRACIVCDRELAAARCDCGSATFSPEDPEVRQLLERQRIDVVDRFDQRVFAWLSLLVGVPLFFLLSHFTASTRRHGPLIHHRWEGGFDLGVPILVTLGLGLAVSWVYERHLRRRRPATPASGPVSGSTPRDENRCGIGG